MGSVCCVLMKASNQSPGTQTLSGILPLGYSNAESEGLSAQHGPLALFDGLLLLALLSKLDKAVASASQTAVTTPLYTTQRSILGI